jgi:hypothetical protein
MNHQFDNLTKAVAQSATRRGALKKFGVGLAAMALACFGLANKADAYNGKQCFKRCMKSCVDVYMGQGYSLDMATATCQPQCSWWCAQ